jgi:hypothetical protein
VGLLCVEKDPFRDSGLPSIDVGHKPNISRSGEPFLSSHLFFSIFKQRYISAILKGFYLKVKEISEEVQKSLITPIMKRL